VTGSATSTTRGAWDNAPPTSLLLPLWLPLLPRLCMVASLQDHDSSSTTHTEAGAASAGELQQRQAMQAHMLDVWWNEEWGRR
jgi:hypothetical protein